MKKLLVLTSVVLLGTASIWYLTKDFKNLDLPGAELSDPEITDSIDEGGGESLELRALAIIERPVVVTAKLTDSARSQAKDEIRKINEVLKEDYDLPEYWIDLGSYRKLIGDFDGAIAAWDFAGVIRPKDHVSFHNLGGLYAFYIKDYEKGEQNFLKSINNNPNNVSAYLELAVMYESTGDFISAENILLLGARANPNDAYFMSRVAGYYRDRGNKIEALKYFEKALRLDPGNSAIQSEISQLQPD